MIIKSSYERDLLPENNLGLEVIPQVITNDADEFLFVAKYVRELGYKELNWNLIYAWRGIKQAIKSNSTEDLKDN
jgi:hypothetical protein